MAQVNAPDERHPFSRYQHPDEGPSLGDLLEENGDSPVPVSEVPVLPAQPVIDADLVRAAGLRKLEGQHLVLYTDLPSSPEIDELPAAFDAAVPYWCEYFGVAPERVAEWRLVGSLMQKENRERFAAAGLLPEGLPEFLHGYQRGAQLWMYEQPSDYYRRHLLLHEGTHGFMNNLLGGAGPPWYMEGIAERLSTHRWENGRLTMAIVPRDNDEAPYWARVKIVRDELAAGRHMSLSQVMDYGPTAHLQVEPYAWCWAACTFFDEHPLTREAFQTLPGHVLDAEFSRDFRAQLADDWPAVAEAWQLFVVNMQYGYDVAAEAISYAPGEPLPAGGAEVVVSAAGGWQSSGYHLEAGRRYRISAEGRYTIAHDGQPWPCEPGGVTIRYHDDLPLGMLLGALRPDDWQGPQLTPLATPGPLGLERTVQPETSGTLYLRVNDSPAELGDNQGECRVRIVPE